MVYDVVIIGTGVTGASVARELSRYKLRVCMLEKNSDVAMGASSANSGIVHAGYDPVPGSLKAKLNVQGSRLMEKTAAELNVPFKRIGSLVLAFNDNEMAGIKELYERGVVNGVDEMQLLNGEQVRSVEPNVSIAAVGALYAPTAGITSSYELCFGMVENAVENGVELITNCRVEDIKPEDYLYQRIFNLVTVRGNIRARYVVNAAGVYSDAVSSLAGDGSFTINPRKGEYLLLDKNQGKIVNKVIFQAPTSLGKGVLVTPTVEGNLLTGPNSTATSDKEDFCVSGPGLKEVEVSALKSVPSISFREVIHSFAGLRATPSSDDFIIGESSLVKHFINAAGIESPGLTAAPAVGGFVAGILAESGLELVLKESFNPYRKPRKRFSDMDDNERMEAVKKDPQYGTIVCRCEMVTEAEVIESIRRTAGARSLDGVKRRSRAGMGRCQGGFCTPRVMEIMSRELGIPMESITKKGGHSWILKGRTK